MVIASSKPNLPISIPIAISFASSFKWDQSTTAAAKFFDVKGRKITKNC